MFLTTNQQILNIANEPDPNDYNNNNQSIYLLSYPLALLTVYALKDSRTYNRRIGTFLFQQVKEVKEVKEVKNCVNTLITTNDILDIKRD